MVTQRQHKAQTKAYTRAAIAIALIVVWSLAALTGFLLYLAPSGPHSGWLIIFFLTSFWCETQTGGDNSLKMVMKWLEFEAIRSQIGQKVYLSRLAPEFCNKN